MIIYDLDSILLKYTAVGSSSVQNQPHIPTCIIFPSQDFFLKCTFKKSDKDILNFSVCVNNSWFLWSDHPHVQYNIKIVSDPSEANKEVLKQLQTPSLCFLQTIGETSAYLHYPPPLCLPFSFYRIMFLNLGVVTRSG